MVRFRRRATHKPWEERQERITLGLLIGGILAALLIAIIIFICYRRRRRANKQLSNGREPVYTASEVEPKAAKAKKSANGKEKGGNYAAVEFEPKAGGRGRSRPKKPEQGSGDQGVNYAAVRVRPVSNPRYASNP